MSAATRELRDVARGGNVGGNIQRIGDFLSPVDIA
jgi:hypothetical protein